MNLFCKSKFILLIHFCKPQCLSPRLFNFALFILGIKKSHKDDGDGNNCIAFFQIISTTFWKAQSCRLKSKLMKLYIAKDTSTDSVHLLVSGNCSLE